MQNRSTELAKAIANNDHAGVKDLLEHGCKLESDDFMSAFIWPNNYSDTDPALLNLLDKHHALPENVTLPTLKFVLYCYGNCKIHPGMFADQTVSVNGCPGLPSPIILLRYNEQMVRMLINAGAEDRPLFLLFLGIHKSHCQFHAGEILDAKYLKEKISQFEDLYAGKTPISRNIDEQCRVAELIITHPTDKLRARIEEEAKSPDQNLCMLPFLAWAARNNRNDLFSAAIFKLQFQKFPEAAIESIKIAAVFGANDFAKSALFCIERERAKEVGRMALGIAAATSKQDLLLLLAGVMDELGFALKDIIDPSHRFDTTDGEYQPLLWALQCNNMEAFDYFLRSGVEPNGYLDDLLQHTCLHVASAKGNKTAVIRLMESGANLECPDRFQETPLHWAVKNKHWDTAFTLVNDYHANLQAKDYKHKTVLDYVTDADIKNRLINGVSPALLHYGARP